MLKFRVNNHSLRNIYFGGKRQHESIIGAFIEAISLGSWS